MVHTLFHFFQKNIWQNRFYTVLYVLSLRKTVDSNKCDSGVVGNARPCQGRDRGFEPRLSLWGSDLVGAFLCLNPPYKAVTVFCILHKKIPLILSEIIYKGHLILNKKSLVQFAFLSEDSLLTHLSIRVFSSLHFVQDLLLLHFIILSEYNIFS